MPPTVDLDPEKLLRTEPVHWAWKVIGSMIVAVLLLFSTLQVATGLAHEEYTEVAEFDAASVDVIEIHNSPGSVRVVASESETVDAIKVTARVSDGFRKTGHSEAVEGNRLMLRATCPIMFSSFCEVRYTVVTPPDVDVVVRSESSVTVTDMDGMVDIDTRDGHVDVARIGGPLRIDTADGGISATDLRSEDVDVHTVDGGVNVDFDRSPHAVRAKTTDGSVEIVIPDEEDVAYALTTNTSDGDIDTPVRSDPFSDRSIVVETTDGNLTVRYG
jgi:hypothetical protein